MPSCSGRTGMLRVPWGAPGVPRCLGCAGVVRVPRDARGVPEDAQGAPGCSRCTRMLWVPWDALGVPRCLGCAGLLRVLWDSPGEQGYFGYPRAYSGCTGMFGIHQRMLKVLWDAPGAPGCSGCSESILDARVAQGCSEYSVMLWVLWDALGCSECFGIFRVCSDVWGAPGCSGNILTQDRDPGGRQCCTLCSGSRKEGDGQFGAMLLSFSQPGHTAMALGESWGGGLRAGSTRAGPGTSARAGSQYKKDWTESSGDVRALAQAG